MFLLLHMRDTVKTSVVGAETDLGRGASVTAGRLSGVQSFISSNRIGLFLMHTAKIHLHCAPVYI